MEESKSSTIRSTRAVLVGIIITLIPVSFFTYVSVVGWATNPPLFPIILILASGGLVGYLILGMRCRKSIHRVLRTWVKNIAVLGCGFFLFFILFSVVFPIIPLRFYFAFDACANFGGGPSRCTPQYLENWAETNGYDECEGGGGGSEFVGALSCVDYFPFEKVLCEHYRSGQCWPYSR